MTRCVLAIVTCFAVCIPAALTYPPPPKEQPKPDYDKLAKEAVEKLSTAIAARKTDDAIKLMGFPFREASGEMKTAEEMTKSLDCESGGLKILKITVSGVTTADTLVEWAKKETVDLEATKVLNDRVKLTGKDARFVVTKFELGETTSINLVLLIKVDMGGVKIVGASR